MTPGEWIFILVMATTLAGALAAVLSGSLIYAMFGLVTAMFGIAGLYIYLNAPFLAMMQILIYVGAISILIAFAIMLAGPMYRKPKEWTSLAKFAAALAVALLSLLLLAKVIIGDLPNRKRRQTSCRDHPRTGQGIFGQAHPSL